MSLAVYLGRLIASLQAELTTFNDTVLTIKLFTNDDLDPTSATVLEDFTEATFSGYTGISLAYWDVAGVVYTAPRAVGTHPAVVFTADAVDEEDIYGYYVMDNAESELYFSEKFTDGPFTMGQFAGQTLTVTPQYTRRSEFHST